MDDSPKTVSQQLNQDDVPYWCQNKLAKILQTAISEALPEKENVCILIQISLMFVPKRPIGEASTLVQVMDWCH